MKNFDLLDDRDFNELFKKLWKEKFFILIITIIFSLLFYFYSLSFFKKFRTEIVIQNSPAHLFVEYDKFYKLIFNMKIALAFASFLFAFTEADTLAKVT